jgi:hypothetical protein
MRFSDRTTETYPRDGILGLGIFLREVNSCSAGQKYPNFIEIEGAFSSLS